MRTTICLALVVMTGTLTTCGREEAPPSSQPAAPPLEQVTAEAVARIPKTKTEDPIRLKVDSEQFIAVFGHHGSSSLALDADPEWHYWGHLDKHRSDAERLHVLTAMLRAEVARRAKGADGASLATLEVHVPENVRCGAALRIIRLAGADDGVRVRRYWLRKGEDDAGVRLELDTGSHPAAPGATRLSVVSAVLRSAGRGKPDLATLDGEKAFSCYPKKTPEEYRESLSQAWERRQAAQGETPAASCALRVRVEYGSPPYAWSVIAVLAAGRDLGLGALRWTAAPFKE